MVTKLEKMQRFIPSFYKPTTNIGVRGLLYSWSGEDDLIIQAITDAKEQLFTKYAQLNYLDTLGSNVGVFRPTAVGLADAQFRELIPALSFYPKQVKPTVQKILEVFFGVGNPRVSIAEINPNEIVISIPSSVPALRRDLKGSHHFHNYYGEIVSVDNIFKTVTVNLYGNTKNLAVDELKNSQFGQELLSYTVLSNTAGMTGVTIQFDITMDLSPLSTLKKFNVANVVDYPGSFFQDLTKSYSITKQRGSIGQNIVAGNLYPTLLMQDASGIPDKPGFLCFDFGNRYEELDVKYFGRPNNTTLLIDASYAFSKNHSIGSVVNVIVKPYIKPAKDGSDYPIYFVGVTAARILAQQIVQSVLAAGIVVRWIVTEPVC